MFFCWEIIRPLVSVSVAPSQTPCFPVGNGHGKGLHVRKGCLLCLIKSNSKYHISIYNVLYYIYSIYIYSTYIYITVGVWSLLAVNEARMLSLLKFDRSILVAILRDPRQQITDH